MGRVWLLRLSTPCRANGSQWWCVGWYLLALIASSPLLADSPFAAFAHWTTDQRSSADEAVQQTRGVVLRPALDVELSQGEIREEHSIDEGHRSEALRFTAEVIAGLATHQPPLAVAMSRDLEADRAGATPGSERDAVSLHLRACWHSLLVARQAQMAASQAMQLHYGLATVLALEPIQMESVVYLEAMRARQQAANEQGVPIADPTGLDRLIASIRDTQIEGRYQASQLRSQLALLVEPSIACQYLPEPMEIPQSLVPPFDRCEWIEAAYRQRCDLAALIYLRQHLSVETLDVARAVSDRLASSLPVIPTSVACGSHCLPFFSLIFGKGKRDAEAEHRELCQRLALLDDAILALRKKIASEVEVAIDKTMAAAERYANAETRHSLWSTRIEQLQKYGAEVQAQPAEELEAALSRFQVRSEMVRRQGDWHQAIAELSGAVGFIPTRE